MAWEQGLLMFRSWLGASVVASWLIPALMFLVVIALCWAGLLWIRSEHIAALHSVSLFSELSRRQLMSILRAARPVQFQTEEEIIEEGDQGKGFHAVTEGNVTVLVDGKDVATLGPGSYFGEMAVIDGGRRTATITATTRVSTLELTPSAFLRILDREPLVGKAVAAELCRRLRDVGGDASDCDGDAPVDRARLAELSQRLRKTQHPDWQAAPPDRAHRLRLSRLVARGS